MKILFIRFNSLGDVVLCSGVINQFCSQHPNAEVHFYTSGDLESLARRIPGVNKVHCITKSETPFELFRAFRKISKEVDYIVDLHSNLRSKLFFLASPFKYRSYRKNSLSRRLFVWTKFKFFRQRHVVEKYLSPLKKITAFDITSLEELRPILNSTEHSKVYDVVIHPFASKSTKCWPYFSELIPLLQESGLKVAVIGFGKKLTLPSGVSDFTNKTSIEEMLKIIQQSQVVVTNDSGPMHIGVAFNKQVLALFGSTTKDFGFFPEFEKCVTLENTNLSCRPCHVHGQNSCPKEHFKCMKTLSVNQVFQQTKSLIPKGN